MRKHASGSGLFVAATTVALLFAVPVAAQEAPYCPIDVDGRVANVIYEGSRVYFQPLVEYERLVLTVTTPCSTQVREFGRGEEPSFDVREAAGELDGLYTWELRVVPVVDPQVRKALEASREGGDPLTLLLFQQKGLLPDGPMVDSAAFTVVDGAILPPEEEEGRDGKSLADRSPGTGIRNGGGGLTPTVAADQVIPDDLIVQGSLCTGFDCVNNEAFSFDTIRLKENNLRIHFDDTSTAAGFPNRDWRIIANDSANGGASKFSVEDSTGAKTPFTIRAGAPTNSVFVDGTGRVGFKTSTPVLDLHVSSSNTPALRLEQTSAGGFTAQTWDIAGNEANFFVRDVTGGSRLPFRIRPGAATSSLDISADGDIGIGTASPQARLHVAGSGEVRFPGGTASVNGFTTHFRFAVDGNNYIRGTTVMADDGGFVGIGCLSPNADLVIGGGVSANCNAPPFTSITAGSLPVTSSSRTFKTNLAAVAVPNILDKIKDVGVYTFDFISGPTDRLGLMAEDFHQIFGRGSDKMIDSGEITSALWLAVQELTARNDALMQRLDALEAKLDAGEPATSHAP